ncbi:MAG: hypothetical protein KKA07_14300, partial [Bacteroidetes bacterium]|nr:hypothetical protein [Bacteroidota bacterium]
FNTSTNYKLIKIRRTFIGDPRTFRIFMFTEQQWGSYYRTMGWPAAGWIDDIRMPSQSATASYGFPLADGILPNDPFYLDHVPSYAGTWTIGTTGDWPTLYDAFGDIGYNGISGNLTLLLEDETYTETNGVTIDLVPNSSPSRRITIKPAIGITPEIYFDDLYGLILRASTYLTIDGSNIEGGTTRDLEIKNISGTSFDIIEYAMNGPGCQYNVLKNCKITGNSMTMPASRGIVFTGEGHHFNIFAKMRLRT